MCASVCYNKLRLKADNSVLTWTTQYLLTLSHVMRWIFIMQICLRVNVSFSIRFISVQWILGWIIWERGYFKEKLVSWVCLRSVPCVTCSERTIILCSRYLTTSCSKFLYITSTTFSHACAYSLIRNIIYLYYFHYQLQWLVICC